MVKLDLLLMTWLSLPGARSLTVSRASFVRGLAAAPFVAVSQSRAVSGGGKD